eukprot:scaffold233810_cov30-Tisochrysis_lutea.AAC.1
MPTSPVGRRPLAAVLSPNSPHPAGPKFTSLSKPPPESPIPADEARKLLRPRSKSSPWVSAPSLQSGWGQRVCVRSPMQQVVQSRGGVTRTISAQDVEAVLRSSTDGMMSLDEVVEAMGFDRISLLGLCKICPQRIAVGPSSDGNGLSLRLRGPAAPASATRGKDGLTNTPGDALRTRGLVDDIPIHPLSPAQDALQQSSTARRGLEEAFAKVVASDTVAFRERIALRTSASSLSPDAILCATMMAYSDAEASLPNLYRSTELVESPHSLLASSYMFEFEASPGAAVLPELATQPSNKPFVDGGACLETSKTSVYGAELPSLMADSNSPELLMALTPPFSNGLNDVARNAARAPSSPLVPTSHLYLLDSSNDDPTVPLAVPIQAAFRSDTNPKDSGKALENNELQGQSTPLSLPSKFHEAPPEEILLATDQDPLNTTSNSSSSNPNTPLPSLGFGVADTPLEPSFQTPQVASFPATPIILTARNNIPVDPATFTVAATPDWLRQAERVLVDGAVGASPVGSSLARHTISHEDNFSLRNGRRTSSFFRLNFFSAGGVAGLAVLGLLFWCSLVGGAPKLGSLELTSKQAQDVEMLGLTKTTATDESGYFGSTDSPKKREGVLKPTSSTLGAFRVPIDTGETDVLITDEVDINPGKEEDVIIADVAYMFAMVETHKVATRLDNDGPGAHDDDCVSPQHWRRPLAIGAPPVRLAIRPPHASLPASDDRPSRSNASDATAMPQDSQLGQDLKSTHHNAQRQGEYNDAPDLFHGSIIHQPRSQKDRVSTSSAFKRDDCTSKLLAAILGLILAAAMWHQLRSPSFGRASGAYPMVIATFLRASYLLIRKGLEASNHVCDRCHARLFSRGFVVAPTTLEGSGTDPTTRSPHPFGHIESQTKSNGNDLDLMVSSELERSHDKEETSSASQSARSLVSDVSAMERAGNTDQSSDRGPSPNLSERSTNMRHEVGTPEWDAECSREPRSARLTQPASSPSGMMADSGRARRTRSTPTRTTANEDLGSERRYLLSLRQDAPGIIVSPVRRSRRQSVLGASGTRVVPSPPPDRRRATTRTAEPAREIETRSIVRRRLAA